MQIGKAYVIHNWQQLLLTMGRPSFRKFPRGGGGPSKYENKGGGARSSSVCAQSASL
jgi:hypothetical protein